MKTKSWLLNFGRIALFVVSIIFALGWLVAPDLVAKQRDWIAAFVRLPSHSAPRVSPPLSSFRDDVAPAPVQKISAHVES
jgi:hypothetical protein